MLYCPYCYSHSSYGGEVVRMKKGIGKLLIAFFVCALITPSLEGKGILSGSFNWYLNTILYSTLFLTGLELAYGGKK